MSTSPFPTALPFPRHSTKIFFYFNLTCPSSTFPSFSTIYTTLKVAFNAFVYPLTLHIFRLSILPFLTPHSVPPPCKFSFFFLSLSYFLTTCHVSSLCVFHLPANMHPLQSSTLTTSLHHTTPCHTLSLRIFNHSCLRTLHSTSS